MGQMRTALIADHPPNTGIGRYSFELRKQLMQSFGEEFKFIFVRWSTSDYTPDEEFTRTISMTSHWPLRSVGYARAIAHSPLPRDFDLYHATHPMLARASPWQDKTVTTVFDLLPVVMPHNYPRLFRLWFRFALRGLAQCREIIATSNSTKRDLLAVTGIKEKQISVIPMGVGEWFTPGPSACPQLGLPSNKKILLHVGSEERRKNIRFLLTVLDRLSERRDDILLVRVGEMRTESKRAIAELGLKDKVVYAGSLDNEQLPPYYRSASVFLFPSLYEGFGLPPLEAMACGCPVISSSESSLPEVVGDGGLKLDLDADKWSVEISALLDNSQRAKEAAAAGIRRASGFSWKRIADRTSEVYERAVA